MHVDEIDNDSEPERETAEGNLWMAATLLFVGDALAYWRGGSTYSASSHVREAAFDDLCRTGPMTRHLAGMAGVSPSWLASNFVRALEESEPLKRKAG